MAERTSPSTPKAATPASTPAGASEQTATPRVSALHGCVGDAATLARGQTTVALTEVPDLRLQQISAWHDTLEEVAKIAAEAAQVPSAPAPGWSESAGGRALLRVEPLKWWLIGGDAPPLDPTHLDPAQGATLDLSHSRSHLRITGEAATTLLNRHLPLDLRPASFPVNRVASSALHHVGVTLWHSDPGQYDLFIPRGFAQSLWEVLLQTAAQFK